MTVRRNDSFWGKCAYRIKSWWTTLIGMDGLKKLRLRVNGDELQLEVEEDELFEEEEVAS